MECNSLQLSPSISHFARIVSPFFSVDAEVSLRRLNLTDVGVGCRDPIIDVRHIESLIHLTLFFGRGKMGTFMIKLNVYIYIHIINNLNSQTRQRVLRFLSFDQPESDLGV
jgi:hypothetical protein